ncbi:hypothetical protein MPDQ_007260 [Monascus purpureus]|uniref:Exocyst complex component Sec8 n=1 Tax=Monascus purpureus TaxID=5098 RepID=A0A507QVW3_MONPU|nr:hypothetical protein MPDQ_007260 [Monascus purpureus]
MNGRSGYSNGYSDAGRYDRNDGGHDNNSGLGADTYGGSRGREHRPGGYGGFQFEDTQLLPSATSRSPARGHDQGYRDRQPSKSRSRTRDAGSRTRDVESATRRQKLRDVSPREEYTSSRAREVNRLDTTIGDGSNGNAGGTQAIEDLLQSIQRDWDFMASDDCVPVQVALQLMDTSTLGKADRESDFLRMREQIQKTLKSIVNEHHQGFNSSIGTYHKIQSSIQSSQARVRNLRNSLDQAKAGLLLTKPELNGLATSSRKYDEVLQLFSQIEELQSLPEKLESQISDKRFLSAIDVLHDAFRLLRRSELENIGSLADLRAYFNNQETSLTDILVEELHDHLYLKSPYCSDRWKPPVPEGENDSDPAPGWMGTVSWERPVYSFLAKLDASTPMMDDASRNPEADTFYYIQLLIEALNKMGHLDVAVDRIEQRLPVELFAVVDKTNTEVDSRYPTLTRSLGSQDSKANLPTEIIKSRGHVLTEYLWALYSKFEAIAEGHRVVHDVITAIVDREGLAKGSTLTGGFKELWKLYQSEIRSLLHDYLATDGDYSFRLGGEETNPRNGLIMGQRDKNKVAKRTSLLDMRSVLTSMQKMFKLSEMEQNTEMKTERDELDELLRTSVPGLVSKSRQKATTTETSRTRQGNSGTGHKILIEPSVFNISLLLPPSLSFIQRLKDIVPVDTDIATSTLTSFLDDFLVNVFLPQLDDTVTDLCTFNLIAADAFIEDPQWAKVSPRPVFKATIVTKVSPRGAGQRLKAAAAFAESGEVYDVVAELRGATGERKRELIDKGIDLLLKSTDETPLEPYDIVSDPKTVVALSLLHNSMQWLASHLAKLRQNPSTSESSRPPSQSESMHHGPRSRRWTLITAMRPQRDSFSQPVYLPLNNVTANALDTTLQSLRKLATTALFALHIDIRCGIIHMLTKTMAGPEPQAIRTSVPATPSPNLNVNWWHILLNQPTAASSTVLQLNSDLIAFDTSISSYLGPEDRWFMTSGLARFVDRVFVACSRYIGAMNDNGALRLQLDVLVLQQNLKNIIIDPTAEEPEVVALPRSAKFLEWFLEGADKALDYAKEEKEIYTKNSQEALALGIDEPFTYDELKELVELCFSEILRGPRGAENREDFMAAKKASADAMLRLNEIMWDSK